jgi:hypothetical protein
MSSFALHTLGKAAAERVIGDGPSPMRAFAAAVITGTTTAAITYRLLRSGGDE